MSFGYPSAFNSSTFDFIPVSPAYPVFTSPMAHPLQVAFEGDDYRTIGSMITFAQLSDASAPSTKEDLMRKYLYFFGLGRNIHALFHADKLTAVRMDSIRYTDDSFNNIISRRWSFPGGEPSSSTGKDPVVRYPQAGTFNVTLTVANGTDSSSIIKKDYIRINDYAGTPPEITAKKIILYPNPVHGQFFLTFDMPAKVSVFDITGRKRIEQQITSTNQGISTRTLERGLYLVVIATEKGSRTEKIIVE